MTVPIQEHKHAVKTVIVPAAGMGTRFLPATKTVPKELLPVVDTPGIEMIAEEAANLGASRLAIITAPKKQGVLAHFDPHPELEETLSERGKEEQLAKVRRAPELIKAVAVEQERPLGLGHAVEYFDAMICQVGSAASGLWIRVGRGIDHPGNARLEQRMGTWPGAPDVVARLQRDDGGSAPRSIARGAQRHDLSMFSGAMRRLGAAQANDVAIR